MLQEMPRRNSDSITESGESKPKSDKPKSSRKTMTDLFGPSKFNPVSNNDNDDSRSTMESYERTIPPTKEQNPEKTGTDATPGSGDAQIELGFEGYRPSTEITAKEIQELAAATSQKILELRRSYEEDARAKSPWENTPSSSDIAVTEKRTDGLSNKTRVALAIVLGTILGAAGTGFYRSLTSTDSANQHSDPTTQNPDSSK